MEDPERFVRQQFEIFNSGDLEGAVARLTEDVVWYPYLGQVGGTVYLGRDQILAMWRDINESLSEFRVEPQSIEAHGDRVLVAVRAEGVGAGSRADVVESWFQVWTLRGEEVAEVAAFETREAALERATSA